MKGNIKSAFHKNYPFILTGLGIFGGIATVVLAVKATPKALRLLDDEMGKREEACEEHEEPEPLTVAETIKIAWKCYIPTAISGGLSILCVIAANAAHAKRNAALTAAYALSQSALIEYQDKVREVIGEKKEREIKDAVAKSKMEKHPVAANEIHDTGTGRTLCYDCISGRYFHSDIDKIKKAENRLNARLIDEMYISLNDFYYELGLKPVKIGNELGWSVDSGLMELDYSSILTDDDEPCLVIDYRIAPRYEFSKLL